MKRYFDDLPRYLLVAALMGLAEVLTFYSPFFTEKTYFLPFAAVIVSALYLGLGPSLVAIVLAVLLDNYFYVGDPNILAFGTAEALETIVLMSLTLPIVSIIHQQKKLREQMEYYSSHDFLTGLPNRRLFEEHVSQVYEMARRNKRRFALMLLDLDDFKRVNDTYGHAIGDSLLKEVAERFLGCIRREDMVARIGGDESVILLSEALDVESVEGVARKIHACLAKPLVLSEIEISVTVSIGAALYPLHGRTMDELGKNADSALYATKYAGKNGFSVYGEPYVSLETVPARSFETLSAEGTLK